MTPAIINQDAVLAVAHELETATPERATELYGAWNMLKRKVREYDAMMQASMVQNIESNGGSYDVAGVRYYVGWNKTTRCVNVPMAVQTLLEYGGPELLAECLASNPFKHGAVKGQLMKQDDQKMYDQLFETISEQAVKEGKPKKVQTIPLERISNDREPASEATD